MANLDVTVTYCDVEFDVIGTYVSGERETNSGACIDDCQIFICGNDMFNILSVRQIEAIEELAIEKFLE
jgi:hypothetical protein